MSATAQAAPRRGLSWSWGHALQGATFAAPAALVTAFDPEQGLPLALGVLSCNGVALPPQRRRRVMLVLIGVLAGLSMFVGSLLAVLPAVLTLAAVFGACVLVTVTSSRWRFGPFLLILGLPLMCAGLSEDSAADGAGAALIMTVGAVYCWLVSLLWPEGRRLPLGRPSPRRHAPSWSTTASAWASREASQPARDSSWAGTIRAGRRPRRWSSGVRIRR